MCVCVCVLRLHKSVAVAAAAAILKCFQFIYARLSLEPYLIIHSRSAQLDACEGQSRAREYRRFFISLISRGCYGGGGETVMELTRQAAAVRV